DLLDYAGPGVYARDDAGTTNPGMPANAMNVQVTTRLRNTSPRRRILTGAVRAEDAGGKTVASASFTSALPAGKTGQAQSSLSIPAPHLWDGRKDPYLYRIVV